MQQHNKGQAKGMNDSQENSNIIMSGVWNISTRITVDWKADQGGPCKPYLRHLDFILRELGDIKALSHYSGEIRSKDNWDAWWGMNWRVPGPRQGTQLLYYCSVDNSC